MVSAILLHYVIDDPLPTRGTFGDPGTNSGADNFFSSFLALNVFLFSHMLSSFSTCSYYLNCFSTWYVRLLLVTYQVVTYYIPSRKNYILHITYYILHITYYILHITYYILHITYQVENYILHITYYIPSRKKNKIW